MLGYFLEPSGNGLEERLRKLREGRVERARRMLDKLAALGLPLEWERVRQLAAGESVGRPHVARAMVEKGYVSSMDEAFALYIGSNGPAYVARLRVTPAEAIAMIRHAHGVPVLAHPLRVSDIAAPLKKVGLQGLEATYPGYTPEEVRYLQQAARQNGLVATGGSDFHGADVMAVELGAATVPFETVEELRQRRK